MKKLNIIFAGTPFFAVPSLEGLIRSKHNICAVFTQPDRPSGRGKKITFSAIKQIAIKHDIPIYQPISLKDESIANIFKEHKVDLFIVVAYGLIIPKAILDLPSGGCINVHGSILPALRGAAPIQYAIINGDETTGISIMYMEQGLDTGPVLLQDRLSINDDDTTASLSVKLSILGNDLLLKTIESYCNNKLSPKIQDNSKATHAPKITKEMAKIDWQKSAISINRLIRALVPNPVAYFTIGDERIKVFESTILNVSGEPGTILAISKDGLDVATGDGVIRITMCQFPGKKPIDGNALFNAYKSKFDIGMQLDKEF